MALGIDIFDILYKIIYNIHIIAFKGKALQEEGLVFLWNASKKQEIKLILLCRFRKKVDERQKKINMSNINYQKISQDLVSDLGPKQREIIVRRFGLESGERETLESIGKSYHICRERVRQIEKTNLDKMKKKASAYKEVFKTFTKYLKNAGGVKKEDMLLNDLGEGRWQAQVYFLMTLSSEFLRVSESDDFHALWTLDEGTLDKAKKIDELICQKLYEKKQPVTLKELASWTAEKKNFVESYIEASKKIQKNQEGLYGLSDWPEINPKGIKDKIYLLFKKYQKPFHFTEVAGQIKGSLVQTVHNELIRDSRFVLIGRGIYALKEWGYQEGDVKDVILSIFSKEEKPLTKQEIVERVLKQRIIKENTILMNLSNKKVFSKDPQGRYSLIKVREA